MTQNNAVSSNHSGATRFDFQPSKGNITLCAMHKPSLAKEISGTFTVTPKMTLIDSENKAVDGVKLATGLKHPDLIKISVNGPIVLENGKGHANITLTFYDGVVNFDGFPFHTVPTYRGNSEGKITSHPKDNVFKYNGKGKGKGEPLTAAA